MSVVSDFEAAIGEYLDLPKEHIICCNSGSSALLAVLLSQINQDTLVATSPFTFPATINAIYLAGGFPFFVDVLPDSHHLNIELAEKIVRQNNGIILYPSLFQQEMILPEILELPKSILIEDAAQNFNPSVVRNHFADFATFSFYQNKKLSTFEGGAIYASSIYFADKIRSIVNQGRGKGRHDFVNFGFNFRLAEPLAQIGLNNLVNRRFNLKEKQMTDGFYPYIVPDLPYMKYKQFVSDELTNARKLAKKVASYVNETSNYTV